MIFIEFTEDVNQDDTKRAMLAETVVEFILCSRMKASAPAPPNGVVLYPLPPTLLVLQDSSDIQVISLSRLLKPVVKPIAPVSTAKVFISFKFLQMINHLNKFIFLNH